MPKTIEELLEALPAYIDYNNFSLDLVIKKSVNDIWEVSYESEELNGRCRFYHRLGLRDALEGVYNDLKTNNYL